MDWFPLVLVASGLGGTALAGSRLLWRAFRDRRLLGSLPQLGLAARTAAGGEVMAEGRVGSLEVQLSVDRVTLSIGPGGDGPQVSRLELSLTGPDGFWPGVALAPTLLGPKAERREALLVVLAEGSLQGELREGDQLDFSEGRLRVSLPLTVGRDPLVVAQRIIEALEVQAQDPEGLWGALGSLAKDDPRPAIRRSALLQLARLRPDRLSAEALRPFALDDAVEVRIAALSIDVEPTADRARRLEGLKDPSPNVRLEASLRLGLEGQAALAALVQDPEAPGEVRRLALEALWPGLSLEDRIERLSALAGSPDATGIWAVESLIELGDARAQEILDTLRPPNPVAARRVLLALEQARRLGPLLAYLQIDSEDAVEGAIDALGRVGDRTAVMSLDRVRQSHPARSLRQAAQLAIELIQARTGGVPGALALASGDSQGALSEAATAAGLLSVPQEEEP